MSSAPFTRGDTRGDPAKRLSKEQAGCFSVFRDEFASLVETSTISQMNHLVKRQADDIDHLRKELANLRAMKLDFESSAGAAMREATSSAATSFPMSLISSSVNTSPCPLLT